MSRRNALDALKTVAVVRDLQQKVEEQALADASALVGRLETRRSQAIDAARTAQDEWLRQHQIGRFDPTLALAFGQALLRTQGSVVRAGDDLARGEKAKQAQTEVLQLAQARLEAAKQLRDRTAKKSRRAAEERRLAEQADRAALRGRQS